MAIGVVSDDDFFGEVNKSESKPKVIIPDIVPSSNPRGRGVGNVEVPEALRKIIGETNELDGRQDAIALAQQFGISSSSVSAYANGATSTATYNETKGSIRNHINAAKERISKKARARLNLALEHITSDKLKEAPLKVISSVAKDMSGIVKDMEPAKEDSNKDNNNRPQFVFYSPVFKKEEHFETIILNE